MKILVTYKSKTGNSERYARNIAKNLQAELREFRRVDAATMRGYDVIIYGAGVYAASLNGLKKVKVMFAQSRAEKLVLFATGGSPNSMAADIDAFWHRMLLNDDFLQIPHFYMQAGINYGKMGAVDKTLMKMAASHLNRKTDKSEEERKAAEMMAKSYDIVDFQYAEPLISYVKSLGEKA